MIRENTPAGLANQAVPAAQAKACVMSTVLVQQREIALAAGKRNVMDVDVLGVGSVVSAHKRGLMQSVAEDQSRYYTMYPSCCHCHSKSSVQPCLTLLRIVQTQALAVDRGGLQGNTTERSWSRGERSLSTDERSAGDGSMIITEHSMIIW